MSPHGICKLRNQLTMLFSVHIFISFLSKNILFCVKQTKKETHTGMEQHESKQIMT